VNRLRAIVVGLALAALAACGTPANNEPMCRADSPTILMAESVPTASEIPCIRSLPEGWAFESFRADESSASFSIAQQDGGGTLEVTLTATCPEAPAHPDEEQNTGAIWMSSFPGGCSVARLTFTQPPPPGASDVVHRSLGSIRRDEVASVAPAYGAA